MSATEQEIVTVPIEQETSTPETVSSPTEGSEPNPEASSFSASSSSSSSSPPSSNESEKIEFEQTIRLLGNWPVDSFGQTMPASKPVAEIFKNKLYPKGEILEYPIDNERRTKDATFARREEILQAGWEDLRRAAECHRQVRKYAQTIIKP